MSHVNVMLNQIKFCSLFILQIRDIIFTNFKFVVFLKII